MRARPRAVETEVEATEGKAALRTEAVGEDGDARARRARMAVGETADEREAEEKEKGEADSRAGGGGRDEEEDAAAARGEEGVSGAYEETESERVAREGGGRKGRGADSGSKGPSAGCGSTRKSVTTTSPSSVGVSSTGWRCRR